jgi:hypothetical protein
MGYSKLNIDETDFLISALNLMAEVGPMVTERNLSMVTMEGSKRALLSESLRKQMVPAGISKANMILMKLFPMKITIVSGPTNGNKLVNLKVRF